MSQSTAPTYDKSHYSWAPPSTQSSQNIIKSSDSAAEHEKTSTPAAQEQPSTIPVIPRRSSYNYAQDSARFSGSGEQAREKVSDNEVEGLQRKLFHERKKSYTVEDQKRMQHEFMLGNSGDPQSFSES